jgi:hypothetical protein
MERAGVHDQFRRPEKGKMYFLERETPLRHSEWKLLDVMKNNSSARARAGEKERARSSRRMQKPGNFFLVVPLPSDDERTTICADRKRERFIFCAT